MVRKISVSLYDETLAQLEYLRDALGLSPNIKMSTLIQQIVFDDYMHHQKPRKVSAHGFFGCQDDCDVCPDGPICDYSRSIDRYMI